ncbi:MAG: SDR family NAD(P)-dependent oxidoreductase [Thaumarchaeota archaeon]|nr:SDR family NAD(P)-dependent oxidoreductase [Nitrososphaerota archaeon]MDE1817775.1 SDR family NAD(P)-dependent oxidoreductase [Nitrososphaerota archaeon]MDE1875359.1 SDR family NAD(P)-dependent oxidoreductase [Nitrososphaerota archaeon]
MLKFQNKIIVITGSGTGIGKAIAMKFAENGANIVILGRRKEPLEEAAKELEQVISSVKSNSFVKIFPGVDVSDEEGVSKMFEDLKKSHGAVDIVVNNAGVSGPVTCFANSPISEFKSTVGIHLTGTFWTSSQAIKTMKPGSKIVTISTFFTEERPYEQRPYRFRSPYTASQGAKNRLAEAMSWEITDKKIISIATNPGPVHSDRIYKTVYPKAAAEFMRVSGFENITPEEVESVNNDILPLLGEDEKTVKEGIVKAAAKLAKLKSITSESDIEKLGNTISALLAKIQQIAEKVQNNTSKMIADEQFLTQQQVAETVLMLSDDNIAQILNGKVIPGDRVFYPVKPHIACSIPEVQPNFSSKITVFALDATDESDVVRAEHLAQKIESAGGKTVILISKTSPKVAEERLAKFHSHVMDITSQENVKRMLNTATQKVGPIGNVIYMTGKVPQVGKLVDLARKDWDSLVDKFINTPAIFMQESLGIFVPGGAKNPPLFKGKDGNMIIIGPDMPAGGKTTGADRARVEVFRGALRPFATTVNQELSDVLKSKLRMYLVLPGSVEGTESSNDNIMKAINYLTSGKSISNAEIIYYPDETRS